MPTMQRRQLLRAGLVGGAGLAAAGWAPMGGVVAGGSRMATPVQLARVVLTPHLLGHLASFDATEHVHDGVLDIMLWPGDRARLDALGASYDIAEEDWHRAFVEERRAEATLAHRLGGESNRRDGYADRVTYRVLADYVAEMDALADLHPNLAQRFTLAPESWQGRPLEGLVIGGNVSKAQTDGRPQAMLCGLHHAREWPSGEFTMNMAHDLLTGHADGDDQVRSLVEGLCVFVIPVSNPDGFMRSREWLPVAESSLVWSTGADTALIVAEDGPGKRRNLRDNGSGNTAPFAQDIGVDTNRNYPLMWGGVGASPSPSSQTYHGPTPGSEPEVQAMLGLLRRTQIIAGISNHTSGDLMLRPWGFTADDGPDEGLLADLGAAMADHINYTNGSWNEALYPGTGIWDDWLHGIQGTLAYTMEHFTTAETGLAAPFHPAYAAFVQDKYASVRASYLTMLEAALSPSTHLLIAGDAPVGTRLTLRKDVEIAYSVADPDSGDEYAIESLAADSVVGSTGSFLLHANPNASRFTSQMFDEGDEVYLLDATFPDGTTRRVEVDGERGEVVDVTL